MKGNTIFYKKIGNTKGTFHTKMGTIKGRNGKDLTVAEKINKRWQEYTDTTKVLMTWITMTVWSLTQSRTFWSVKSSGP